MGGDIMDDSEILKKELEIQKRIAYTAGLLQGDITIKTLLESLAEGVVIINDLGRIVLINKKLSELTGFSKEEVMGESLNLIIPAKYHHKHEEHVKNYFNKPRIRPMGIGLDLEAQRKDNTKFAVEISLSHLDTDSGRLSLGFLTDITVRKKAENDLLKRNIELDEYAHTVAHDLNSSISGILGFSELLINSKKKLDKKTQDVYLNHIAVSGRKMQDVVRELLLFASMKKGDIELSPVKMKELISSACQRLNHLINEKLAQINISPQIADCKGHAPWVEEIWYNYLSNALKYGGESPIIEIYSEKNKEGLIKYSVKDNGEGISKDFQKIIFEHNNAVKEKLAKGSGLGLSIVKRIADKLDGLVSVESEPGKGSVFSFYLREQ
ncbi:MAG: PAS domain-containing sensor histidine kinase [Bacteroidales bacterium]|nr:PAS domain-containing sensor histidine kinase [Bacteroidales bacterium]